MLRKVDETVRDSVVREQDLRQRISPPGMFQEPLQFEESVRVEPRKQATLPMHASKFIHYDAHDAPLVSLQTFVVSEPINRHLTPVEPRIRLRPHPLVVEHVPPVTGVRSSSGDLPMERRVVKTDNLWRLIWVNANLLCVAGATT